MANINVLFLIEKIIFLAHIFPHLLTSPEKCNPKESNRTYNLICHRGNCCCCSVNKVKVKNIQSCPTLCIPMDYTVHGILQAKILEWVAFSFSRGSSQSRDWTQVSHIAGGFFTSWATREVHVWSYVSIIITLCACSVAQSCLTLCDPMHCSLPGSSLHGILQARILQWAAIPFSRGSSQSRD